MIGSARQIGDRRKAGIREVEVDEGVASGWTPSGADRRQNQGKNECDGTTRGGERPSDHLQIDVGRNGVLSAGLAMISATG
jgi:hypothetical protein